MSLKSQQAPDFELAMAWKIKSWKRVRVSLFCWKS